MSETSSDSLSKTQILIGVVVCIVVVLGVLWWFSPQWYQNYAPKQPIPFSHRIHAGDHHIPCLYCHQAAEYAAHAEVPGLELCMNCHTQVKTDSPWIQQVTKAYNENKPIKWVKVHVLPDFVYFRHNRHIAAGIQCQTCHGPVQTMDRVYQWAGLNMGWCINCHRNNNYLTPHRVELLKKEAEMKGGAKPEWFQMLSHPNPSNADVSCSVCHN